MGDGKYMLRVGYLLSAAPAVEEQRFPTDAFAEHFHRMALPWEMARRTTL